MFYKSKLTLALFEQITFIIINDMFKSTVINLFKIKTTLTFLFDKDFI